MLNAQQNAQLAGVLGGGLSQAQPRQSSPTECALDALKSANQNLGSAIKRLEEKMASVLVPITPSPPGDGRAFPSSEALLPEAIIQEARMLDNYADAILALLDRCVL